VFVWPLTDRPEEVFADGNPVLLGDTEGELGDPPDVLVIDGVRPFKRGFLVGFVGRSDRSSVESLAGRYLLSHRPTGTEPDAWHYHELLGMTVVTVSGDAVGTVREVFELAPADLLEVEAADGSRRLVPLAKHVVRQVDVAENRIVIDPPPGLLDL
jgi:16S rRNA processing protein RimM